MVFSGTPGESHSVTVGIKGDTKAEATETIAVGLKVIAWGGGAQFVGIDPRASIETITILDDDVATAEFNWTYSAVWTFNETTVESGPNPVLDIPVKLSNPSDAPLRVYFTMVGSGNSPATPMPIDTLVQMTTH